MWNDGGMRDAAVIIIGIVIIGTGFYLWLRSSDGSPAQVATTTQAHISNPPTIDASATSTSVGDVGTITQISDTVRCITFPNYVIVEKSLAPNVGTDILVKYITATDTVPTCAYAPGVGDYAISGTNTAQYFLGLENNFLLLDNGTAPPPRGLTIFDLSTRKKAFQDKYSGPVMAQHNTVEYWSPTDISVTQANCPDKDVFAQQGLGAVLEERVSLNLSTMTKNPLGQIQCVAVQ